MTQFDPSQTQAALKARFQDAPELSAELRDISAPLASMAGRGSVRAFSEKPVPPDLIELLCAVALSTPSKSDLQQRDIIVLDDPELRRQIADLVEGQTWVAGAPMLLIFCGNNRRQRLLHNWHGVAFANDHLDAFFNAAADAAIALGGCVTAAEALGLGSCPISGVRNKAAALSQLLELPDHVFPFAGLALGYPKAAPRISMRLPLRVTCHKNRYREDKLREAVADYDAAREAAQPYAAQRDPARFGAAETYGWSLDKARQYNTPERANFGAFVRKRGFNLA